MRDNTNTRMIALLMLVLGVAVPITAAESRGGGPGAQQTSAPTGSHAEDYSDLDTRPLADLLKERSESHNAQRVQKLDTYLREKAAPRTSADLKFVESELTQGDESRRRRALVWLSNISDAKMSLDLVQFLKDRSQSYPPGRLVELAKHPEMLSKDLPRAEVLGAVMLKLADLNAREAIPRIREYATAEGGLRNVRTELGAQAIQALARIKDESFFGVDRRERLRARYVDFSDPRTKPWLMEPC